MRVTPACERAAAQKQSTRQHVGVGGEGGCVGDGDPPSSALTRIQVVGPACSFALALHPTRTSVPFLAGALLTVAACAQPGMRTRAVVVVCAVTVMVAVSPNGYLFSECASSSSNVE